MFRFSVNLLLFTLIFGIYRPECTNSSFAGLHYLSFRLGDDVLLSSGIDEIKNKRIAVLTNQTGILSDGTHIIDALVGKEINIVKIFSPEHGIRGDENYSDKDDKTGIPIVSLYGEKNKPSKSDLSDVDIFVYDIQDAGARFYTYTSTLNYAIEACNDNNIEIIVCDRPIIINPNYVDGFMLEPAYKSFVGSIPVPVCYGFTCGELANYLNAVYYNSGNLVKISKMENYSRSTEYNSLNLKWVKPSPSMFTSSTAVCYPAECFLEGSNVSEGRGTDKPFEYFGAPWMNAPAIADELNSYNLNGVKFEPVTFTPSEKISSYPPKFFNIQCSGVFLNITDKNKFEAVKTGVAILVELFKLCPEFKFNKDNFIDKLAGSDKLRKMIIADNDFNSIVSLWENDVNRFKDEREKYLLYK